VWLVPGDAKACFQLFQQGIPGLVVARVDPLMRTLTPRYARGPLNSHVNP